MNRRLFTMMLGAAASMAPAADTAVTQQLKDAEKRWVQAVTKVDQAGLAKVLHDDIVYTHSTGIVDTKKSYIQSLSAGQKYDSIEPTDLKVAAYGNTGVVTGTFRMRGSTKGQPFDNKLRFTHVWVKDGGGWKLVAHQTTRLAQ